MGVSPYRSGQTLTPLMKTLEFFRDNGLIAPDAVVFAKAFQVFMRFAGKGACWDLKKSRHRIFSGFINSKRNHLFYKTMDARPFLLAMIGQFPEPGKTVIVRRHTCGCKYCLNPTHYYYGTKADVRMETNQRNGDVLTPELVDLIRGADEGLSSKAVSKRFNVSYQRVRKIRLGQTFEAVQDRADTPTLREGWNTLEKVLHHLASSHPQEVRRYELDFHMTSEMECPWHRNGTKEHKGRFGHMGECLDCLEELKQGKCTVDVTQFDYRWYWTVKRFWDQVDVRGEDECWPWLGATKKGGSESVAYCPSPVHSGATQSAMRIAFWLSRGFVGKYRIHTRKTCEKFCCNPLHLEARGLDDVPVPSKIENIQLNYVNIFEHFKKAGIQDGDDSPESLPS